MMVRSQLSTQRLSHLLAGMADVHIDEDRDISGLSLDSRTAGEGDLFLACAGTNVHGAAYIEQVLGAGVAAVAWEPDERYRDVSSLPGASQSSPTASMGRRQPASL